MSGFFEIDWKSMFVPTESVLEIVIRGSVMYLVMFGLLRIFRRQAGSIGIADLLVIVVIADAAQNGMAGESKSITEAILLIVTIVLWDWAMDFLAMRSALVRRLLEPKPLPLIEHGKLLRRNLRHEMITVEELEGQLRQQGYEKVSEVKRAWLESDGHFSFIRKDDADAVKSNPRDDKAVN